MLPASSQTDPIVEILQLAYRRGLAIRQEQEKQNQIVKPEHSVNHGDVHRDPAIDKYVRSTK